MEIIEIVICQGLNLLLAMSMGGFMDGDYGHAGALCRLEGTGEVDGTQLLTERDRRRLEIAATHATGWFAGLLKRHEMFIRIGSFTTGLALGQCVRPVNLDEEA